MFLASARLSAVGSCAVYGAVRCFHLVGVPAALKTAECRRSGEEDDRKHLFISVPCWTPREVWITPQHIYKGSCYSLGCFWKTAPFKLRGAGPCNKGDLVTFDSPVCPDLHALIYLYKISC